MIVKIKKLLVVILSAVIGIFSAIPAHADSTQYVKVFSSFTYNTGEKYTKIIDYCFLTPDNGAMVVFNSPDTVDRLDTQSFYIGFIMDCTNVSDPENFVYNYFQLQKRTYTTNGFSSDSGSFSGQSIYDDKKFNIWSFHGNKFHATKYKDTNYYIAWDGVTCYSVSGVRYPSDTPYFDHNLTFSEVQDIIYQLTVSHTVTIPTRMNNPVVNGPKNNILGLDHWWGSYLPTETSYPKFKKSGYRNSGYYSIIPFSSGSLKSDDSSFSFPDDYAREKTVLTNRSLILQAINSLAEKVSSISPSISFPDDYAREGTLESIKSWLSDTYKDMTAKLQAWFNDIYKWFNNIQSDIQKGVSDITSTLYADFNQFVDGNLKSIFGLINGFMNMTGSMLNAIINSIKDIPSTVSEGGKNIWDFLTAIVDALTHIVDRLIDGISDIIGGLFKGLQKVFVPSEDQVSELKTKVSDMKAQTGFFGQSVDVLKQVGESVSSGLVKGENSFKWSDVSLFGQVIIPSGVVNLDDYSNNLGFSTIHTLIKTFLSGIMVWNTVLFVYKKFKKVFRI